MLGPGCAWMLVLAFLLALPSIVSLSWLSIVTEMLILSLAACALNLIMGYAGMVSFGAGGLYGIGAYGTGLLLVYTNTPFGIAVIAGPVMAGLISIIIGWLCVRRTLIYFTLLSFALSQLIWVVVFKWRSLTRGDDGIVGIRIPDFLISIPHYYYFALATVAICLALLWMIVNSPFGKTLEAIRENPRRTESIGINVKKYQLGVFVIQGFFLGVAGSLICGFTQALFPSYASWLESADIFLVCLMGGVYHFTGPIVGSLIYILLSKILSNYTMYWPLFLGVIIVLVALFFRGGAVGFISDKFSDIKRLRKQKIEVTS